jgi:GTPase KRas protein
VVVDGEPVVLSVLDTAGQEEFSAMRSQYLSTGKGFLLCYSITNQQTFDEVKAIQTQVLQAKDTDYVPMVLVATKSDLEASRKVSRVAGETLAKAWGCPFLESSARERLNVEEAFFQVTREIRRVEAAANATETPKKQATGNRFNLPNLPNIPTCTGCVLC